MEQAPLFNSPEEELGYLREQVAQKERQIKERGDEVYRPNVVNETLREYKQKTPEETLTKELKLSHMHKDAIVLELQPEPHDEKIADLLGILQERGVMNALSVIEKMNNPHLEDDFHRFLVQYIKEGLPPVGLPEKDPLVKALHYTLYEV